MSRTVTINGSDRTSSIRLDSLATVEAAYGGEVGIGGCDRDDEALGDVPAMKAVTITESAASPTTLFTGATGPRAIDRGRLGSVDNRRSWGVSLLDLNTFLDDEVLSVNAANRPAETDYARVTWLLTQAAMTDLSITAGVVPNTNTVTLDANDYRSATPRQVLGDCAEAAGKNFFLYNYGSGNLLYYDKHTGTSLSSSARLTTVAADVDNAVTWAIEEPKLEQDPTRIYSEVVFRYGPADQNLTVTVDNATTESTYRFRAIYVTDESITTAAAATVVANQYLDAASSEETTLTCAVTLPAANVNDIRAGQRVQIKATHLNISSYTYYRVTRRKVMGAPGRSGLSDVVYRLELEFAPDVKMTHFGSGKGGNAQPADCTDCTKRTAILPSGMDENLSLAEGLSHMFVYDWPDLAKYNCGVTLVGTATTSASDLHTIDHEPVHEALFAGDRAFYVGTVGPLGDDRWSIDATIQAGAVMDIRKAWAAGGATVVDDTFTRTVAANGVGTSDNGIDWDASSGTFVNGGTSSQEVDGTEYKYTGGATAGRNSAQFAVDIPGIGESDFIVTGKVTITYSHNATTGTDEGYVQFAHSATPTFIIQVGQEGPARDILVGGSTSDHDTTTVLTSATAYRFRWEHYQSGGGISRARVWAASGAEPGTWNVTRSFTPASEPVTGSPADSFSVFTSGGGISQLLLDDLVISSYSLQRRDMVDGSLEASALVVQPVYDVRTTPNGQHLFLLDGTAGSDGPLQRFDRTPAQEDSYNITGIYDDLADFNVDDAYNVYKLTPAGLLTRYGASSGSSVWSVDLNAVYGYQFPSRALLSPTSASYGQTIIADSAKGTVKVCGYIGGATWTSGGSYGTVLTLDRADGSLLSQDNQVTTGGNAAAQTIAMCVMGPCLWLAGAADGTDFESNTISGVNGWLMKVPY